MTGTAVDATPTRERILAAAAKALSTHGYAKTHLADIARLAEVRPPALYHYFSSRDEIITAVLCEGQRLVRTHVLAALDAAPPDADVRTLVALAVEAHLRVELELSDFARAVSRNAGQLPPHLRAELQRESEAFHDVWRGLLGGAAAEQRLRPDVHPGVARMLVVGSLNWASEWWRPQVPVETVVRTAQAVVDRALFA